MNLSIITINYNNSVGLQRTVDSVLSQTYADFEFIIVDGASTDGSKQILEHLQQEKQAGNILFPLTIISEPDAGIYNAMNKGIRLAKGAYLQFLNSGDYLTAPTILSQVFEQACNIDIIYGDRIDVNDAGLYEPHAAPDKVTISYLHVSALPHQASFIKRSLFVRVGLYREDLIYASDWVFYLQALVHHNATTQHLNLSVVYFDRTGISSQPSNRAEMVAERERAFSETLPYIVDDIQRLEFYQTKFRQYDRKAQKVGKIVLYVPRLCYHSFVTFVRCITKSKKIMCKKQA